MMRGLIASSLADARFGLLILVLASLLAGCTSAGTAVSGCGVPTPCGPKAVVGNPGGGPVEWDDAVHFDTDKSEIRADDKKVIARAAELLIKYPQARVIIEGYADERGTREYNLALGARRANAYRTALIAAGVAPERIADTISYGKERPVADGSNEAAWAQNRRAVAVPQG